MFSSSSTPPAEHAPGGAGERRKSIAPWILVGIWCFLMLFGLVAIINPPWLRSLAESGAEAEAVSFADRGDQRIREGDFRGALWWYERALKADPTHVPTRVNAAIAYGQLGRFDEGIRLLREVLSTGTRQRGVVLYNLGELQRRKGELPEAIESYTEALGEGGRPELIYARLGECYRARQDNASASDAYRRAIAAWEDPVTHYRNMLVATVGMYEEHASHAGAEDALARGVTAADLERYDLETLRAQLKQDAERARLVARLRELESQTP
jgi:tetratricopeptide (TPR) repeat protein